MSVESHVQSAPDAAQDGPWSMVVTSTGEHDDLSDNWAHHHHHQGYQVDGSSTADEVYSGHEHSDHDPHTAHVEKPYPPPHNPELDFLGMTFTPKTVRAENVKRFCFSKLGVVFQIVFNSVMALLTTFVVLYELLVLKTHPAPLWYICIDVGIVVLLAAEVYLRFVEASTKWTIYIRRFENRFDFTVMVFSASVLLLYILETTSFANDAETAMLILRIVRDVVRFARVIYFIKSLGHGVIDFGRVESFDHLHRNHLRSPGSGKLSSNPTPGRQYGAFSSLPVPSRSLSQGNSPLFAPTNPTGVTQNRKPDPPYLSIHS